MAGTGRRAEPVAHRADVTAAVPSGRAGGEQVGAGTPSRPAVMADVAIAAGVSHQTVSRVLNGHPHVRPATRDRVLAAIEQLGYRRNPSARALVTRRTLTIGVVAYNTTLFGPARTLHGVERAAHQAGYSTSLTTAEGMSADALWSALQQVLSRSVDGIVLVAPRYAAEDVVPRLPRDVPVVVVESGDPDEVPVVRVDQHLGGRLAAEHLLALGHSTVWHVAGPSGWDEASGRLEGWRAALRTAGAAEPEPLRGDWGPRSGYEAGLALDPAATAVFVGNDQMALGMLTALRERGLRVPQDVSLVGFDDIPEGAYFAPPLTTVAQDFAELGRQAIRLLLEQAVRGPQARDAGSVGAGSVGAGSVGAGETGAGVTGAVVAPRLVVRESTAAPTRS